MLLLKKCRIQKFIEKKNVKKAVYSNVFTHISSIVYIQEDRGNRLEIRSAEGITDTLGEIFYVTKVVIALYVFVWRLIVGIYISRVWEREDPSC